MSAPLPVDFYVKTPPMEDIPESVQELMNRVADSLGTTFINPPNIIFGQLGGSAPTTNIGPWANGAQWWFWEPSLGKYQRGIEGVPIGMVMMWGSPGVPPNWLLCDGSEVLRTQYNQLHQVIGDTWGGGDGVTTFNLPPGGLFYLNQKGFRPVASVPIDASGNGRGYFVNGQGGNQLAALLVAANMPPMKVPVPYVMAAKKTQGGVYTLAFLYPANQPNVEGWDFILCDAQGTQLNTLTQTQFSITPPFVAVNYIIKAG
jgi:microcystin-dependent protein